MDVNVCQTTQRALFVAKIMGDYYEYYNYGHSSYGQSDKRLRKDIQTLEGQLRRSHRDLSYVLESHNKLVPFARRGAALYIFRWWSRTRAQRRWRFIQTYFTDMFAARASWRAHLQTLET